MFIGNNLIELDVVDSTNNYAANLLVQTKLVNGTAIMTHFQTGGRGQRGSDWVSEPGKNLLFSIVLNGHFINTNNYFLLSKAIAIGINEALEEVSGKTSYVKWPNDIYINQKKIAGILIENQWKGNVLEVAIVGVGVNVNQITFDQLSDVTSLCLLGSKNYDLHEILKKIFEKIEVYYNLLRKGEIELINRMYFNHLMFSNEWKIYDSINGRIEGKIIEVKESGLIVLKLRNNEKKAFNFKDLRFIL